jgi:hypothetical protein
MVAYYLAVTMLSGEDRRRFYVPGKDFINTFTSVSTEYAVLYMFDTGQHLL